MKVIDRSGLSGALRAAEEIGFARGFGAGLEVLESFRNIATPGELIVLAKLAFLFHAQCTQQIAQLEARKAPNAKGVMA
jgi:hypothetical protein